MAIGYEKKNCIIYCVLGSVSLSYAYLVLYLDAAQAHHGGPQPLVHHGRHVADLVQHLHSE